MNLKKEIRLLIEYWKDHDRDALAPQDMGEW